jgi:hypothetical protein
MTSFGLQKPSSYFTRDALSPLQSPASTFWGFHGGDYEEWRLLGYKNPVHNSYETHYVSATESSQYDLRFSRRWLWRMASSGMLRRVALVRTDFSEKLSASFAACVGCSLRLTLFLVHRFLSPWWRRRVPPKCRFLQEPQGVASQKKQFFSISFYLFIGLQWNRDHAHLQKKNPSLHPSVINGTEIVIWKIPGKENSPNLH